ncbi:MAG: SDR family oxidoreductase [Acidobacteria bacterium]|mgnify:CR=1 FL=1|nr:SDR family oxidoreductase [Acidobacteriota bacterium]
MKEHARTAIVTGASSGIGEAFARRLHREGYRLVLVARRADRLEKLARELPPAEALEADLSLDGGIERVARRIGAEPGLELLVNNAGFEVPGRFWEADPGALDRMHRLHVLCVERLTRAALERLVPQGRGGVINVASMAGFFSIPGAVAYGATKAWVTRFTEGLHLELRSAGSPVRVQALCPGFTRSEFHAAAGMAAGAIPRPLWMTAEEVVDVSLRALARNRVVVIPGWKYRLTAALGRALPRFLTDAAILEYSRRTKTDNFRR